MNKMIVTGYVPIAGHPRSIDEYYKLGKKLLGLSSCPVRFFKSTIFDCLLYKTLNKLDKKITHSEGDNPAKNTMAYHIVNHQKTEWVSQAALENPDVDTFIWMDFGIFHMPGVTSQIVEGFLERIVKDDFAIPGCWEANMRSLGDIYPDWRFCGSMFVIPGKLAAPWNLEVFRTLYKHIEKHAHVPWEVNTWARAERLGKFPIRWYKADHNETMFTEYNPP